MRSRAIVVGAVLGVSVVSGGWLVRSGLTGAFSTSAGARLFDQVLEHVARDYVDSLPVGELYQHAVSGMLEQLDDPNSVYLSEERLSRLDEQTSGNYTGLGLQFDVRGGWITVIAARRNSPAERAGISTGDRILEIDGSSTAGLTPDEAVRAMRGEPGTTVRLTVERAADGQRVPLVLRRSEIHVGSVSRTAMLPGDVGYVDLNVFGDSSAAEVAAAVDSLRARSARGLILDLRRNPGGLLAQGVAVADLFLDEGRKILEMKGRTPEANAVYADQAPQRWRDLPVVVLVNEGTASAAEIVAGALQDHDRAVVVGRTSFGKGSAQSLFRLDAGGALKLTTARWYTPLGRAIGRPFGAELPAEDEEELESAPPAERREEFRTPAGRIVYGGGGITPDVTVGDTVPPAAELAFQHDLGAQTPLFREVLTDYALSLRGKAAVASPDFVITPGLREALWDHARARGVDVERAVYDSAAPLIDRLLSQEIARYVFGGETSVRRLAQNDRGVQVALSLLGQASTTEELLRAAERRTESGGGEGGVAARRAAP
ncbi:MAG TPA: S41 family peptidase [Gemmatimonadales bacterium]